MPYKNKETRRQRRQNDPEFREREIKRDRARRVAKGHRTKGISTLRDDSGAMLKEWVKTERKPENPPVYPNPDPADVTAVMLDRQGQALIQWIKPKAKESAEEFTATIARAFETYRGLVDPVPAPKVSDQDLCALYVIGDAHVGMLSWHRETGTDFDQRIAASQLQVATDDLVSRTPAAKRAIFVNVGDWHHAQDNSQLTPGHKNKLDVDSRSVKLNELSVILQRRMIDKLLTHHETVEVVEVPGNHDPDFARHLAALMRLAYEREPRVTVADNADPFLFAEHGLNFFMFNHGIVKYPKLKDVMCTYQGGAPWGRTRYRKIIVGHIHHKVREGLGGCDVEAFDTLAPNDYWAHDQAFQDELALNDITVVWQVPRRTRTPSA